MSDDASDPLVREQERLAAQQAGTIGGRSGNQDLPEADRPVQEAGGGVAEGFEQSEADLREHAEFRSDEGIPPLTQMGEEAERDPSVHGEADEIDVHEQVSDPESGMRDDPGEGPGIAHDR